MRAVVQRVTEARVVVAGETVGEIGTGLLVLVGVTHDDGAAAAAALARKIHGLRILRDEASVADSPDAGVLVVSQFTLYGDAGRVGGRPGPLRLPDRLPNRSWTRSCGPARARRDRGHGTLRRGHARGTGQRRPDHRPARVLTG